MTEINWLEKAKEHAVLAYELYAEAEILFDQAAVDDADIARDTSVENPARITAFQKDDDSSRHIAIANMASGIARAQSLETMAYPKPIACESEYCACAGDVQT